MTHTFRDKDIDEIFVIKSPKNTLLHISYLGATEETFYTRKDLQLLLDIIDGKEEGVVVVKAQPPEKPKEPKIRIFKNEKFIGYRE